LTLSPKYIKSFTQIYHITSFNMRVSSLLVVLAAAGAMAQNSVRTSRCSFEISKKKLAADELQLFIN
jgi:hypothetical protein